ncbi:peptide/nickel transport system substrate-binding protein [Caldalkalibacillus uzonensis]|uniref:Peptide/nickel transport system substrate-binding protein n=1 Tax=Caldalkalibacillus uzonensis TaxID=353224 RepID=A0ABU0CPW1_9BACI|nr:ABC transporter substrate-binding protein [Caldalkalibacillus uzonensis]MDQ0338133.1 peptide/nickel transport system substrate-binding protein [Caldalkalibacillus uzonensis]
MLKRKFLLLLLAYSLVLSACSMQVTKESDSDDPKEAGVAENLPEERKVREIELYVTTADYDPVRYEMGLMIAEEWKKLGFDVTVTPLAWNRLSELGMRQKDFDAFTLAWGGRAERIDPDHFVYLTLHSSNAGPGAYNIVGYDNPEYDEIAEQQRATSDVEKRKELVFKAQEMFLEDLPYAPVVHRNQLMAYNKKDFTNVEYMMGEGLNSFWTFMDATPTGDRKVIRWGYPSDIDSLNPLSSTNTHDFQVTRLIYDRLVRISPTGEPQNWAAESITDVNGDGTAYEVKLRSGMKFHDGEPVTAQDVKFSFDLVKEIESPYFLGMVEPIESVEVKDELTIQFNLNQPFAPFISNTLAQMYIFPEHYWKPILEEEGPLAVLEHQNTEIIGSGPFKLDYWRKDEEMKLVRNDEYFEQPKLEGILKIPYANVQGMVAALEQGEADMTGWWIEPIQVQNLENNPNIEVIDVPDHGFYHINFNMRRMPFDDKAVRLAMSYVIPKEQIVDRLLEGYGEVANSIIGPANEFWHNPNVQGFSYDPDKAREILAEAGYQWDENGKIYYPEGKSDADKEKGIIRPVE